MNTCWLPTGGFRRCACRSIHCAKLKADSAMQSFYSLHKAASWHSIRQRHGKSEPAQVLLPRATLAAQGHVPHPSRGEEQARGLRSEEHTSELQSLRHLV